MAYKKMTKEEKDAKYEEFIAELFIKGIKTRQAPWMKPWQPGEPEDFNPITNKNKPYQGSNQMVLELYRTIILHSEDPRWLTFNQIKKMNIGKEEKDQIQLKAGSKGVPIRFYTEKTYGNKQKNNEENDEEEITEIDVLDRKKTYSVLKQYYVFNAKDIIRKIYDENGNVKLDENGKEMYVPALPPLEKKEKINFESNITADELIKNTNVKIYHDQKDRCFYTQTDDSIHMVKPENFKSTQDYYDTLLHELTHWTGGEKRLNREEIIKYGTSKEWRAKEELIAEIGGFMLAKEAKINFNPSENNLAYVDSWVNFLKDKPAEITNACKKANQSKNYILGFSNQNNNAPQAMAIKREIEQENTQEQPKGRRR